MSLKNIKKSMTLLALVAVNSAALLVSSCNDKVEAERIRVNKQDQGQFDLPGSNSLSNPFNLAGEAGTVEYGGNVLIWNDSIDQEFALTLSEMSANDRMLKSEAILRKPAVDAQINKEKFAGEELAMLKGQKAAAELSVLDEKTRNWWQEQLESLPVDGKLITEANKQVSQNHFEHYCEAVIWSFAVNKLARDYTYSARPTPLNMCEPVYQRKNLLSADSEACANAQRGLSKDYFQCFWLEGVVQTHFFREMFGTDLQQSIVERVRNGSLKTELVDISSSTDTLLDGGGIFPKKLENYATPLTYLNFTFADPLTTAEIGAAKVRNPTELKKLLLGRSVNIFSYLLANDAQVKDTKKGVKIVGSTTKLDPLVTDSAQFQQAYSMLNFIDAFSDRKKAGISVNDNSLNLPLAYDLQGNKLGQFDVEHNEEVLEHLQQSKQLMPDFFPASEFDGLITKKTAEFEKVQLETTKVRDLYTNSYYKPATDAVPNQAKFALEHTDSLSALLPADLKVTKTGDVIEYRLRLNSTQSVKNALNPIGADAYSFKYHQVCINAVSGQQVGCPNIDASAITDILTADYNTALGQLTLSALVVDVSALGLVEFSNESDAQLCKLDNNQLQGLQFDLKMVSNTYNEVLSVVSGDIHIKVPGASKDRYKGSFQFTNYNQMMK